jgi:tetratricopeptide (TPR) repeat protein
MDPQRSPFDALAETAASGGADAVFDQLAEVLEKAGKYPQLFEALLMKKRHALGLPLQGPDSLRDLPEPLQEELERCYVDVCRRVGGLFLERGDIVSAWPYFRAIDEPDRVKEALERWQPEARSASGGYDEAAESRKDAIFHIALNEGAHPTRGFELVLEHHGVCRAITTFEHQFPYSGEVREECGKKLVRRLYSDLRNNLEADVRSRGGKVPDGAGIRALIEANPSLFEEHGYHIDVSHLQAVVRFSASLRAREELELALEMTEYGRRLPRDFQTGDVPPFDDFYSDYRIFLQALLGIGGDGAVRYFRQKADRVAPGEDGRHFPGEVYVHLLYRTGRYEEAIEAHRKYLSRSTQLSIAPSLLELSERTSDYASLLEVARERDDLLQYTAGLVKRKGVATKD